MAKKRKHAAALAGFRRKFIVTNMIFVAVVLASVLTAVGVANYSQRVTDVYDSLQHRVTLDVEQSKITSVFPGLGETLPRNEGESSSSENESVSADNSGGYTPDAESGQSDSGSDSPDGNASSDTPRREQGLQMEDTVREAIEGSGNQMVATSSFVVDESGNVTSLFDALSMDDETVASAVSIAIDAVKASDETWAQGHVDEWGYYYRIESTGSGYMIAFASEAYVMQGTLSLLGPFLLAGLGALLAFFLISMLLSNWAIRPVERAWRQQQQFIADASHELKTPLTVIIANDSILASQPKATVESQMQWIESTETEARLMQGLVNDMLYLARMEDTEREHVLTSVDFTDLVQNVALQFESVAFERGVLIESDIARNVIVQGDETRLMRMVATLVDNACKYTEPNESVDVKLEVRGQSCRLSVHNSGTPISPEDLPHLFDRFYRADKARTSGKGGYGLGLSIAKSIVEDHGGTIRVASSAAEGTTFTVELPLA